MREIKFRAWDKRGEKMYQVQDLGIGNESWLKTATNYKEQPNTGYNKFYPSEVEIMQYTGLKDKNGKEIYEGDIVKIEYIQTTIEKAVIKYKGASFYGSTFADDWELDEYYEIEVIGNIYDNPELLEE